MGWLTGATLLVFLACAAQSEKALLELHDRQLQKKLASYSEAYARIEQLTVYHLCPGPCLSGASLEVLSLGFLRLGTQCWKNCYLEYRLPLLLLKYLQTKECGVEGERKSKSYS